MPPLHYELTIRNRDDTADLVVVSTVPTDAHPFILTAPTGDGESFDPLTGETAVGTYNLQIVDAPHAVSSRVLTRELADSVKRWNLNGNKARLRYSEVEPVVWQAFVHGYLTRHEMLDALAFDLDIGETRYLEERYEVFKTVSTAFDRASNLIGPPIRNGFGPIPSLELWKFKVESVFATWVGLTLEAKPPGWTSSTPHDRNMKARDYRVLTSKWRSTIGSEAWYPRLNARLETTAGALVGHFNPIAGPRINDLGIEGDLFTIAPNPDIFLDWPAGGPVAQPAVGTEYFVWVFPVDVSAKNPLHVSAHPVDIHASAYVEAGIPYDAASVTALKATLGSDLWLDLRPTGAMSIADLARRLQGIFGYATRIGPNGERVFLPTRIRGATAPALTITKNDLRDEGIPFSLDVKSAVSSIAVRQQNFYRFDPAIDTGEPALDLIVAVNQRSIGDVPDAIEIGQQEVLFEIDGQIMQRTFSLLPPIGEMVRVPVNLDQFTAGIGGEIGDRYGRGAWKATHRIRRGIDANIGDEIILDLDYQPNPETTPASRGGQRVVQVVQRTPTPEGLDLELVDSGNAAQLATAPTFTLAAAAEDPKRTVIATLTNAAALIAQGSLVRIEWATGGASRTLLTVHDPNDGATIRLPQVDSGATVDVGMRSEHPTRRPTAYGTATINLADLTAPSGLTITGRIATWTNGETDAPVEILWKRTADAQYQRAALLGAGSAKYNFDWMEGGVSHDVQVRHRDALPLNGVSTALSATFTPTGSAAPSPPTAPSIWAGHENPHGVVEIDGTYGYDVAASTVPGSVEFEVAVETAVGSGTPGSYAVADRVTAVSGGPTRFVAYAPNDGKRRYVRAFSVTPDNVRSATSSPVLSILPWDAVVRQRTGPRRLIDFVADDGTDDGFAAKADDPAGTQLNQSVQQHDGVALRALAKGHWQTQARDGDTIVFPENFQAIPIAVVSGGVPHDPRNASWSAGSYDATKPVYEERGIYDASASSAKVRARLRQRAGSTTARENDFSSGALLTSVGASVDATLANAPSNNDQYTVHFDVSVTAEYTPSGGGHGSATVDVTVGIFTVEGGVPTERWRKSYTRGDSAGGGSSTSTWTGEAIAISASGLASPDAIRLQIIEVSEDPDTVATYSVNPYVKAIDGTAGVTYGTATDSFASMTPETDDRVTVDIFEVSV